MSKSVAYTLSVLFRGLDFVRGVVLRGRFLDDSGRWSFLYENQIFRHRQLYLEHLKKLRYAGRFDVLFCTEVAESARAHRYRCQ